jgi:hypothetical protein
LIAAPGLHREFSTNAQKTARSFTAEKMASQYLAAYSALLTKFPSGIRAAEVLALIKKEPCAVTLWKGASCT